MFDKAGKRGLSEIDRMCAQGGGFRTGATYKNTPHARLYDVARFSPLGGLFESSREARRQIHPMPASRVRKKR